MTPEQVSMVQDSFKKVVPIADTAADLFYDRLFTIAPDVKPLFPSDLREQKKKLITMLATRRHQSAPGRYDSSRRCRTSASGMSPMALPAQHYAPVGAALLWTLEQGLGPDFTPPVKAAWTEAYVTLAGAMQGATATA